MRGFSVLELIVVAAIVVGGSTLTYQAISLQRKGSLRSEEKQSVEALRQAVRLKLSCGKTTDAITGACPSGNIALKDKSGTNFISSSGTDLFSSFRTRAYCTGNKVKQIRVQYQDRNKWNELFPVVPIVCTSKPDADFSKCRADRVALQPDGKIVVGAVCTRSVIYQDPYIIRFNADGSLDDTFGSNGSRGIDLSTTPVGNQVNSQVPWIGVLPSGRIIAAFDDNTHGFLFAVTSAGNLDSGFGTAGISYVQAAPNYSFVFGAIRPDSKLWFENVGIFGSWATEIPPKRFNANGSLDYAIPFNPAMGGRAFRSVHMSFDPSTNLLYTIDGQAMGRDTDNLYCNVINYVNLPASYAYGCPAGTPMANIMQTAFGLVRYNPAGNVDNSFGLSGHRAAVTPQDRALLANVTSASVWFARFFPKEVVFEANKMVVASLVIQGFPPTDATIPSVHTGLYRFMTNTGLLDGSFGTAGKFRTPNPNASGTDYPQWTYSLTRQSTGRYVFMGGHPTCGACSHLVGVTTNGSLDPAFGVGGSAFVGGYVFLDTVGDSSDRIIAVGSQGYSNGLAVIRYNANGAEDTGFNSRKGR